MHALPRLLSLCLVLGSTTMAQMLPGTWIGRNLSTSCNLCAYDDTGAQIAGFTLAGAAPFPTVLKHPNGLVYASDSSSGIISVHTLTSTVATVPGAYVGDLSMLPGGGFAAILGVVFLGPLRVERFSAAGVLLSSVPVPGQITPGTLRADPVGNLWLLDPLGQNVRRFGPSGTLDETFSLSGLALLVSVRRLEVDRQGRAWVSSISSSSIGSPALFRVESGLGATSILTLPGLLDFDIGACGRLIAIRSQGTGVVAETIDLDSGALIESLALPSIANVTSMVVDPVGNLWMEDSVSSSFTLVRRDGTIIPFGQPSLSMIVSRGDATGNHAILVEPLGDADGDGIANAEEVRLGTNPIDPNSLPATLTVLNAPQSGQLFRAQLSSPLDVGDPYVIGSSLTIGEILFDTSCRSIPLGLDPWFLFWLSPQNQFASGISGTLDPMGQAILQIPIPQSPLGNATVHFAAITLNPFQRIKSLSPRLSVVIP